MIFIRLTTYNFNKQYRFHSSEIVRELYRNRSEIVRKSYGNRSEIVHAISFRFTYMHHIRIMIKIYLKGIVQS